MYQSKQTLRHQHVRSFVKTLSSFYLVTFMRYICKSCDEIPIQMWKKDLERTRIAFKDVMKADREKLVDVSVENEEKARKESAKWGHHVRLNHFFHIATSHTVHK